MKLHQDLLNSYDMNHQPQSLSFEGNKTLIEQLLENFAIEMADIEAVISTISGLTSERVKMSILYRLGDFNTNGRFTITDSELNKSENSEKLIASFKHSLTYKYWHTLKNRLKLDNLNPYRNEPITKPFLTFYVDEDHYAFNLENIQKYLNLYTQNLYDADTLKAECKKLFLNYSVVLESSKDGTAKLKINSSDPYNNFRFEIADLINGAMYFTTPEWHLNDSGKAKTANTDIKGVTWTVFKKSSHVLTMNKEVADLFKNFYAIE